MFTPIKNEIDLLLSDLQENQKALANEQMSIANNSCAFIKYEGMLAQGQHCIDRVVESYLNLDLIIEDIMKNAIDGNYSAKMKIIEEENELLRKKLELFDNQAKTIMNNLDNGNKVRAGKKVKKAVEVEENLEL